MKLMPSLSVIVLDRYRSTLIELGEKRNLLKLPLDIIERILQMIFNTMPPTIITPERSVGEDAVNIRDPGRTSNSYRKSIYGMANFDFLKYYLVVDKFVETFLMGPSFTRNRHESGRPRYLSMVDELRFN